MLLIRAQTLHKEQKGTKTSVSKTNKVKRQLSKEKANKRKTVKTHEKVKKRPKNEL